jgi:hypothetical protein
MRDAFHVLRWVWVAIDIVYLLLAITASKRLRGGGKKLNYVIMIALAVLVAIETWIRHAFAVREAYWFWVLFVRPAVGIAALIVAVMLMLQPPGDGTEAAGGKDRIQSLRLH